jgi:dTDP-4-dehydrorhamnose reductase
MKVLVLGKNGQLGLSIKKVLAELVLKNDYFFIGRDQLNLMETLDIERYFNINNIDVILNCTAYTNVDKAEEEKIIARRINSLAIGELAKISARKNIKLIHISTDHVFDGDLNRPYNENDKTCPLNIYGKTKLEGENAILKSLPLNGLIIRTSWLYSEYRKNFVKTMLDLSREKKELNIVSDQYSTPTYCSDLAKVVIDIIEDDSFQKNNKTQIFHYSNNGISSWYGFTKKIFELAEIDCKINPIKATEFYRAAVIPKNTLLSKDKIIKTLNLKIPDWEDSLKKCIAILDK